MDVLAGVMAEAIKAATAPLIARIAVLEARPIIHGRDGRDGVGLPGPAGEKGEKGDRGEPGKDAPPVDTDAIVKAVVTQIPTPTNGRDGKDADTAVIEAMKAQIEGLQAQIADLTTKAQPSQEPVAALVQKAIGAIPIPKDGKDGEPGKDGTSVTVEDVAPLIQAEVAKALAGIQLPKDGANGHDGKDGVGVAGAVIGRDGDLILTLSDGTVKNLGLVVGQRGEKGEPGLNGTNGLDGLGFEDLAVVLEDERTFVITATKGERVKEIGRFTLPVLIYRDVYKPGQKYEPGDVVTWGNQSYVCKEATTIKPGDGPAWRLMVRKGGEGKQGPKGEKGDRGERGEQGPLAKVY